MRNYKKLKTGPAYTPDDLARAVADVENKNKTFKAAEEEYGVPKSVIYHRIKGRKSSLTKLGAGRKIALSETVEEQLQNCIIARARMGLPCDREDVCLAVKQYCDTHPEVKTPFRDNLPGPDWYYGFMKRHPSLSFKKPEHLQKK